MKTSFAPESGSSPGTEKTAGKMTMPARIAARVSIAPTETAVFARFASALK